MRARYAVLGGLFASAAIGQAPPRSLDQQIFIAPSGEPFRVALGSAYPVGSWFAQADRNHDGRISESEFAADFTRFFATLDADHDGTLRGDEIHRYEDEVAPEVQSYGGGIGGDRRGGFEPSAAASSGSADVGKSSEVESDLKAERPTGGGRFGLINIPEPVASMDTDFNGLVSRTEMLSAAHRRFALLDPQGKGALTIAELPSTWAQSHPRRRR
ncbi:MAG: hypothetical protein ABR588_04385 [Sphingomicrobium sp.]|nr:EF-hand domain-containing protein [Sphingomonadales bacterium]